MSRPTLYFDLGSPYAYLAVERAERVLGVKPIFAPVLLGAIFRQRGSGSWALTDRRADGVAEIERRAAAYGLPPLVWPAEWPMNGLQAMRAAVWAEEQGAVEPFATTAFRRQFAAGEDISTPDALAGIAREAGLDGDALRVAIGTDAVKERLKEATADAWERGVRGIPTLVVDGETFFGDDRLDEAARRLT
jgi:2-hydroxychromene-2-carboxylate isomerase